MTHDLEPVFRELGLAQYLDSFVDQGFDTWDTILDIQESDLDALGVKLGHRRKLQRRIANARGIAPSVSLASLKQNATPDGSTSNSPRRDGIKSDSNNESVHSTNGTNGTTGTNGVTKRKYRRHPKADENAPERPPSAYVLFSNKMREDLKSQNLTFTEIAKLVGENWQSLPPNEREVYESQANAAKEKYHRDLTQYKKTPEYKKYSQYLVDFKEKQARQNQVPEVIKRPKLEPVRLRHGSSSSSATPAGTRSSGSRSGSSSERLPGTEPSSNRKRRVDSTASIAESALSNRNSLDDSATSPRSIHFEGSPRDLGYPHASRPASWMERDGSESVSTQLPPLSDVLDDGVRANMSPEYGSNTMNRWDPRRPPATSHAPIPSMLHESSSGSSGSSGVAVPGRPVNDNALPIHALLSNREPGRAPPGHMQLEPMKHIGPNGVTHHDQGRTVSGYGFQTGSSVFQRMNAEQSADGDVVMTSDGTHGANGNGHRQPLPPRKTKVDYNGMDALLQAGEIVGRHVPE